MIQKDAMPVFSHSKIGAFETCRLQYKYRYIDHVQVKRPDTVEAYLGSCVHKALEKLYKDIRYEKRMRLEELQTYFDRLWDQDWSDSIVIVKKDYSSNHYKKMGARYLADYYKHYEPFKGGRILGLETQNYLSLDKEGRYKYHVRIDRLMDMGSGLYEVHDYKTNMKLPLQEDLDRDRQLAMYSIWVREQFKDFKKVRLVWHFLAFDKEMDSVRTAEKLEKLRSDVLSVIRSIEKTDNFPPNVSSLCPWCLFQDICPEWKHEKAVEHLPENEFLNDPGVKLVDEYVRVKAELDAHKKEAEETLAMIKEALIAFSRREKITSVAGSEKKITIKAQNIMKLPGKNTDERRQLVALLEKLGKWKEVADLDVYSLARIIQNEKWEKNVLELLKPFQSSEQSYRLNISKKIQ